MDSMMSGASAVVEFDYVANEPDELTISKGQTITNIKTQPGGWWYGTLKLTGKSGMFPDNFVKLIDQNNDDKVILRDKSSVKNRHCKVIYSYKESKDDELTLAVGDVIEVFEEVEDGWWKGKLGTRVGVFPSNFVELIESATPLTSNRKSASAIATTIIQNKINNNNHVNSNRISLTSSKEDLGNGDGPLLPPKPVRELCKVIYTYNPVNEDELKLVEGDIVTVLSKELPDKGWWKGELKGKIGVFPDNFVTLLPSEPSPAKERPERPPIGTKTIITTNSTSTTTIKSPNLSANNSFRKEHFGSKDSLHDNNTVSHNMIASERSSGIFGNVAAQRKSLESKSFEHTAEKPPRKSLIITDANKTPSEIRKSLENLDEKKTPPPVASKKPNLPIKKSPSVTTVANSIFSGLKQKVKSVESKLHAAQQDGTDGSGASKIQIADNSEKGVIVASIKGPDNENDFDHVERGGSVLMDVRQNRAKAPKRRPPTSATMLIGDSNNNVSMNGSHLEASSETLEPASPTILNNSNGSTEKEKENDGELAKPKSTRTWEKQKAPWMAELKANQAKKTSPSVEKSSPEEEKIDLSKSFSSSFIGRKSQEPQFEARTASLEIKSTSFDAFSKKETTPTPPSTTIIDANSKSTTKISITDNSSSVMTTSTKAASSDEQTVRPTSVNLRNRSISPIARPPSMNHVAKPSITATHITPSAPTVTAAAAITTTAVESSSKVNELELRLHKLETLVSSQNLIIEELKGMLREESEKVRSLRNDLEKYAQCFTQDKKPTSKIFVNNFKH